MPCLAALACSVMLLHAALGPFRVSQAWAACLPESGAVSTTYATLASQSWPIVARLGGYRLLRSLSAFTPICPWANVPTVMEHCGMVHKRLATKFGWELQLCQTKLLWLGRIAARLYA